MPGEDGFTSASTPPLTGGESGGPTSESADGERTRISDLENVYLDNTLVLVGCGKAKRDPDDPTDVHEAVVDPGEPVYGLGAGYGETGPAWRAEDLYTSTYFAVKREFAETVTAWANGRDGTPWAILSAEHGVIPSYAKATPYDTTIDDLGDDPTNQDHWATDPHRRPDGGEVVTEMDKWATKVASTLCKWLGSWDCGSTVPPERTTRTLLVLAGQDYIEPLRERKVFENGIARTTGNPNYGWKPAIETRFLFEEIDASGIGEQMAWLSDAVDRLDPAGDHDAGEQAEMGQWTGNERTCDMCGATARDADLGEYDGEVYCESDAPDRCTHCGTWTHETAPFGTYPLCTECQEIPGHVRGRGLATDDQDDDQTLLADMESEDELTVTDIKTDD